MAGDNFVLSKRALKALSSLKVGKGATPKQAAYAAWHWPGMPTASNWKKNRRCSTCPIYRRDRIEGNPGTTLGSSPAGIGGTAG
jgi:hypothetical protein